MCLTPVKAFLFVTIQTSIFIHAQDSWQLVVVILSQENSFNAGQAQELKQSLLQQAALVPEQRHPIIKVIPHDFDHIGSWTIVPLLPQLRKDYGSNSSWFFFCEDRTAVSLKNLINGLTKLDSKKAQWLGFAVHDEEPTIIHHFAFAEDTTIFKYPLFSSGFAISSALLNSVLGKGEEDEDAGRSEFSIDASHELALQLALPLTHEPSLFCLKQGSHCASYPGPIPSCGPPLNKSEVFFAVKTCEKFHSERIPVVMKTWGQHAAHIEFFSDLQNDSIPTTGVGLKNTHRGHCAKTMVILSLALKRANALNKVKWVVLTDDDTILSVARVLGLLSCYDIDCLVGERYGFNVCQTKTRRGYNYLTGGGGIAVGLAVLPRVLELCRCPSPDAPDDMLLGACAHSFHLPIVHSPLFHQARPVDYSKAYLEIQEPVSFHKHWMIDPESVYKQWFSAADHSWGPLHDEF